MSGKKYTGVLTEKIKLPAFPKPPSLLKHHEQSTNEHIQHSNKALIQSLEKLAQSQYEKIPELFEFFEIPNNDWKSLALALAYKHVKGFQYEIKDSKAGRKKEWDELKLMGLYFDFALKRINLRLKNPQTSYSDASIATMLAKNEWKPLSAKTLHNMYVAAQNSLFIKILNSPDIDAVELLASNIQTNFPHLIKVSRELK